MIRPIIVITHAAFDETRRRSLERLLSQLRVESPRIRVVVQEDRERRGSLWCWRQAMESALMSDATHVVWLPDDAIVCSDFGDILEAAIGARPDDVFDCFANHPMLRAGRVETCWYSTPDGYTGMAGVMPRALLEDHLRWRDDRPELGDYPNDAGVNLWAICTGRRIYKTAWSLVRHDAFMRSLDGHDGQADQGHERVGLHFVDDFRGGVTDDVHNFLGRHFAAPDAHLPGRASGATDLPCTYATNVYDVVRVLRPEHWELARMYDAAAWPPRRTAHRVVVVVPVYREQEEILRMTRPSRDAVQADLEGHGVECLIVEIPGDSHVDRMRMRATHQALKMGATHMLFWDADIECMNPTTVRAMLTTGKGAVAGACPYKDLTGRVVANLHRDTELALKAGGQVSLEGGCIEARDVGTGFLLVSRAVLLTMFEAYPDRCFLSRGAGDKYEPLWALWDAGLVGEEHPDNWTRTLWSRSFDTEDFFFCRLWQELGGRVYIFVPAQFRHWGLFGYAASFEGQYGMRRAG